MRLPYGSRTLIWLCGVLMLLLAALAVVQYRWSARVAAADIQREREHLDSAATLFANEFNGAVGQAAEYVQREARLAVKSGAPLTSLPKLIGQLYYLDVAKQGTTRVQRLTPDGSFTSAVAPDWVSQTHCLPEALTDPPALVSPIYEVASAESHAESSVRILRAFRSERGRCFVAVIDLKYLTEALFPQLIRQSFGESALRDYDFAVVPLNRQGAALYGVARRADLRKPFFSTSPGRLAFSSPPSSPAPGRGQRAIFVQHVESTIIRKGDPMPAGLFGAGIWELDVARKSAPLAEAFERTRRRDLLLSVAVEALLSAAIFVIVMGARRMQRLADQKVRFVAGISHDLRTPVSAIAMLSRNQADGLVSGPERVKQYGELMHQQSRRLNEMVEQTLQYAGVHSGLRRPEAKEIDLRRLIGEAVALRREELAENGFDVEVDTGAGLPPIWGDERLLRTAFDNLLSNALKHAAGGRWMRVTVSYSGREKEVRIAVEDRGAGIDPADQSEIFEPFCRGRAAVEAQIPGSGLGLSLVRSAAEAHRGSVTLVSAPGRGSTFTLHLPV